MGIKIKGKTFQVAGAALIVAAAGWIVLPGLIGYFAGLWRLALMIAVALLCAWGISVAVARFWLAQSSKRKNL